LAISDYRFSTIKGEHMSLNPAFVSTENLTDSIELQLQWSKLFDTPDMNALGYSVTVTAAKLAELAPHGSIFVNTQRNEPHATVLQALVDSSREHKDRIVWGIFGFNAGPENAGVVVARNGEVTTLEGNPYPRLETDPNLLQFQMIKAYPLLTASQEQIKSQVHSHEKVTKPVEDFEPEGLGQLLDDCEILAQQFSTYRNVADSFDPNQDIRSNLDEARAMLHFLKGRNIMMVTPERIDRLASLVDFSMESFCRNLHRIFTVFQSQSIPESLSHKPSVRSESE